MKRQYLLLLLLSFLLSACAVDPSLEEMEMAIQDFTLGSESTEDVVDVYIYYMHADDKRILHGNVDYCLDSRDSRLTSVGYGEYIHFQLSPGSHTLYWQGNGKKRDAIHYDHLSMDFQKNKTYIFRQVHDVIFNRYSSDGLSVISSLSLAKNDTSGKYYLSKAKKQQ